MSTEEIKFAFCGKCEKFTIHHKTESGLYKCRVCDEERLFHIAQVEFDGHVKVTISDREVRLWVCKDGVNVFRLKALGFVRHVEYMEGKQIDVFVMPGDV